MNEPEFVGQRTLRVATLNLVPNDERYVERFETVIAEASQTQVEVLLLQGVVFSYHKQLQSILARYGYQHTAFGDFISNLTNRSSYGNIIISKNSMAGLIPIELTAHADAIQGVSVQLIVNGYQFVFISADMFEGPQNGHMRLRQARIINDFTSRVKQRNPEAIVVLGGDFKETDAADGIRYLKGLRAVEDEVSTFWLDVTEGTPLVNTATSRPDARLGSRTENSPSQAPARKQDFLLAHGWLYGKPGAPVNVTLFGQKSTPSNYEVSTHYGLCADLWIPDKN